MDVDWISRASSFDPRIRNWLAGRWSPIGGSLLHKYSPRDGRLLYTMGCGEHHEIDAAVATAKRAVADGRWSRLSAQLRKEVLIKLAELIERNADELALMECLDVGKPIQDALTFDVPTAAASIRYNAEAIEKLHGRVYASDHASLSYDLHRPVGVVAGIVGWNFPLVLAAGKIGPALATGNCLILKPSELTSLSAARIAELSLEAGLPEGVLNVVHGGPEVGAALAHHQDVDLVTFTGSSSTGKKVMIAAGKSNMKRLILECGGKSPTIVFDDSPDLEGVAEAIVSRAFWNQGEVCTASSRLLVQDTVKEELLRHLTEKASSWHPGDPLRAETRFGALISRSHRRKILEHVAQAQRQGARLIHQTSGVAPFNGGFYMPPTILGDVTPDLRVAQEELFGPVLPVITFSSEEEAVRIANGTVYGLSAVLWTQDLSRAHRVTRAINAGWITVNSTAHPTGGPGESVVAVGGHKQSGIGVEGGIDGLNAYLTSTAVQVFV